MKECTDPRSVFIYETGLLNLDCDAYVEQLETWKEKSLQVQGDSPSEGTQTNALEFEGNYESGIGKTAIISPDHHFPLQRKEKQKIFGRKIGNVYFMMPTCGIKFSMLVFSYILLLFCFRVLYLDAEKNIEFSHLICGVSLLLALLIPPCLALVPDKTADPQVKRTCGYNYFPAFKKCNISVSLLLSP